MLPRKPVKINAALVSRGKQGDKMHMFYDYLTGNEFRQNMEALVEVLWPCAMPLPASAYRPKELEGTRKATRKSVFF